MNDLCIAKNNCRSKGMEICTTACPLFMDIRYQTELSAIPRKHQKHLVSQLPDTFYAIDVFGRFSGNIVERIEGGQGLYLYGALTGTGKSTTACGLALEYIVERLKVDFKQGIRTPQLVQFINVPDFLEALRKGMDSDEAAQRALALTNALKKVPLVIMDDFGAEKISEWSRERLLTIISERYDNESSIIFTSNITLQEVEVLLGMRIRSRIEGMGVPIEFKVQKDWRRKI